MKRCFRPGPFRGGKLGGGMTGCEDESANEKRAQEAAGLGDAGVPWHATSRGISPTWPECLRCHGLDASLRRGVFHFERMASRRCSRPLTACRSVSSGPASATASQRGLAAAIPRGTAPLPPQKTITKEGLHPAKTLASQTRKSRSVVRSFSRVTVLLLHGELLA